MSKILIVDDNPAIRQALGMLLDLHGYQVAEASTPVEAVQAVMYQRIALVIQDMNFSADTTSGEEGKTLFYQLRKLNAQLPIILITAWTELETAVSLVKDGAADYIGKPWDDAKLLTSIANLLQLGNALAENQHFRQQQEQQQASLAGKNLCGLVYASHQMQKLVDMALQLAKSDVSVLITGPNGSGKDKLASIIQANSSLSTQPFIKVNAGALPAELIEAELFGAEAGAYTGNQATRIGRFEAADGGTLFLDEIGNLPLSGQMKMLRVLQSGEFERLGSIQTRKVKVRVISATNANLKTDIQAGRFREDLYYRLNVIELNLPALANRRDDILPLVRHFLPNREWSLSAERTLLNHSWPGNVRELENACRRAAVLNSDGELQPEDFGLDTVSSLHNGQPTADIDRDTIERALVRHNGVVAKAARELGMSRQALYRRMEKFGLQ